MADLGDRGRAPAPGRAAVAPRSLGDRVAEFLAGTGRPLTAREIAKELHVRHADVLDVLRADERFCPRYAPEGFRRNAKPYELCACARSASQSVPEGCEEAA